MRKAIGVVTIIAIAAVAIGIVGTRFLRKGGAVNAADYETVPVRRDTILATVNASGSVVPREQVTLNLLTGGQLAELDVGVGQQVKAGQQLARLDTRQLELSVAQAEAALKVSVARLTQTKVGTQPADLAAAEASVASAQALYDAAKNKLGLRSDQLAVAEADLKRAEFAVQDAQAAYDRVAFRPEIGMLPQASALQRATIDYQRAQSSYKLQVAAIDDTSFKGAAAQLAQAKAQLERLGKAPTAEDLAIAEAQVEQSRLSLEQAKLRLADAILTAPFSGTVLAANVQVGELVGAATPLIVLADMGSYHVETSIDEADIGRIQIGQDATIALDAFPNAELRGKVTHIDLLGRVAQGVVSYAVEVEILPTDTPLRASMTAVVDVVVDRKEGVWVVPNRAVKRDARGKYFVEVMSENKLQQRFVTTGLGNDLVTEIVDGLDEGDQVVVASPRKSVFEQAGGSPFGFGMGGTGR